MQLTTHGTIKMWVQTQREAGIPNLLQDINFPRRGDCSTKWRKSPGQNFSNILSVLYEYFVAIDKHVSFIQN